MRICLYSYDTNCFRVWDTKDPRRVSSYPLSLEMRTRHPKVIAQAAHDLYKGEMAFCFLGEGQGYELPKKFEPTHRRFINWVE